MLDFLFPLIINYRSLYTFELVDYFYSKFKIHFSKYIVYIENSSYFETELENLCWKLE